MKRFLLVIIAMFAVFTLTNCGVSDEQFNSLEENVKALNRKVESLEKDIKSYKTPATTAASTTSSKSQSTTSKPATSFTNKYGTSTTICAHSGCNSYIASSGDTNCCTSHSKKCAECKKYIDEDAVWCVDCLLNAFK
jgi:outer membrane murein-binding lipoprotein Lpp